MKLSLRFFIPLVGITALSVSTPAADMMSHSGSARTRLELMKNVKGVKNDWTDQWLNRVRLNVDISPSKTVMVRFTPQATHTWGTTGLDGTTNDVHVQAYEAWMSWTASDLLSVYVGRQALSYGKGLIIGHNDWDQNSNYFDALRARLTYDMGTTDIIFSRLVDRALVSGSAKAANDNLYGLYTALNPDMGAIKNVDLYALMRDNNSTDTTSHIRLATLGVRADGDIHVVDYNVELSAQFGNVAKVDQKGFQIDATAGAKVMDVHHVGLNLAYANSEFHDLYPDRHMEFGKADIITARNNLIQIGVLTAWKLHDKWKANVDGYYFMAAKDDAGSAGGLNTVASKRALGMEADLGLAYSPEKALTFDAGYNLFKGGDALKTAVPQDEVFHGFFVQGTVNF